MTITVVRPRQPSREPSPQPAAELSPKPVAVTRPTRKLRKRDRYIDSLRVLALVRVMTYHVFGWVWLPILFPSMGIMFALAGSLIAGSLDRSAGNPWRVLKKRAIRLLPPLWLFGLATVPVMLVAGWTYNQTAGDPLSWKTLLFWVLPLSDPPGSKLGADWVTPLWYIRSYLWFLLMSPAMLWLFRHWPKRMMAIPVIVVLLSAVGLLPLSGRSGDVILSIAMFGGCWMLGFAHHDNKIRTLPLIRVLLGGVALMALGLAWAFANPDPASGYDIDNIPVADTLYSLGAVLVLLRLYPDFSWMDKRVVLDKLVTVISSRAMTIYLWGNVAIFLANPLLDKWTVTANLDQDNAIGSLVMYVASWSILIVFVVMFGWCEDLAARRRPTINPWPRSKPQLETMRTPKVLTFPHPRWLTPVTPATTAAAFANAGVDGSNQCWCDLSRLVAIGQMNQHRVARGALHQGANRTRVGLADNWLLDDFVEDDQELGQVTTDEAVDVAGCACVKAKAVLEQRAALEEEQRTGLIDCTLQSCDDNRGSDEPPMPAATDLPAKGLLNLSYPSVKDAGRPRFFLFGLQLVDGFAEWGLARETFRVRWALRRRRSASRIIAFLYAVLIACRIR